MEERFKIWFGILMENGKVVEVICIVYQGVGEGGVKIWDVRQIKEEKQWRVCYIVYRIQMEEWGFKLWVVCNDGKVVEGVLYVQSMMFG